MKLKIFTHLVAASIGFWIAEGSHYFSEHDCLHIPEGRFHR